MQMLSIKRRIAVAVTSSTLTLIDRYILKKGKKKSHIFGLIKVVTTLSLGSSYYIDYIVNGLMIDSCVNANSLNSERYSRKELAR